MSQAVAAIRTGDIPALERELDADPEQMPANVVDVTRALLAHYMPRPQAIAYLESLA